MSRLDDLLAKTSRTFALSIPMLPEPTRGHVSIAYLLFRIADTFDDATLWPVSRRVAALERLCGLLDRDGGEAGAPAEWLADLPVEHAGYVELLRSVPEVLSAYRAMPAAAQAVLRRDLTRTARGMADVVRRADADGRLRLRTMRELRDYCYIVAGIVGEMLTELFLLDAPALAPAAGRLRRRSRFFGEALQLVNILKDAASDESDGRFYLPEPAPFPRAFALARSNLDRAASYVEVLQSVAAPDGLVAFTASPALLAGASLDRLSARGPGAKLTRAEVGALMDRMFEDLAAGRAVLRGRRGDRAVARP